MEHIMEHIFVVYNSSNKTIAYDRFLDHLKCLGVQDRPLLICHGIPLDRLDVLFDKDPSLTESLIKDIKQSRAGVLLSTDGERPAVWICEKTEEPLLAQLKLLPLQPDRKALENAFLDAAGECHLFHPDDDTEALAMRNHIYAFAERTIRYSLQLTNTGGFLRGTIPQWVPLDLPSLVIPERDWTRIASSIRDLIALLCHTDQTCVEIQLTHGGIAEKRDAPCIQKARSEAHYDVSFQVTLSHKGDRIPYEPFLLESDRDGVAALYFIREKDILSARAHSLKELGVDEHQLHRQLTRLLFSLHPKRTVVPDHRVAIDRVEDVYCLKYRLV